MTVAPKDGWTPETLYIYVNRRFLDQEERTRLALAAVEARQKGQHEGWGYVIAGIGILVAGVGVVFHYTK